jgi:histidinol-phosphate aminotransferase
MTPNPSAWALPGQTFERVHGGPDEHGAPMHDFSTNSNACGPCPSALAAVARADASTYPDASYTQLRQQLADFHAVAVQRVVLAASASEFIFRITAMAAQRGVRAVSLPPHSYGDYAQAARAHQLPVLADAPGACLHWSCEPSSPLGGAHEGLSALVDGSAAGGIVVLDRAYEPLRLSGALALDAAQLQKIWQLWTSNKALGLTGVRAAYAIAPLDADADIDTMNQLCPSWPIGAHGVAMLQAWTQLDAQAWLAASLDTLRGWKAQQVALCASLGWTVLPSHANFFVCRWDQDASALAQLRAHGIKLRDCTSFGLPGHVRLSVQPPATQGALQVALQT